jgi:hypothetical protein
VGKGLQPYDWTVIKDDSFEEVAQRLLSLGDEAYGVSAHAGASIHDAAQRLDDAHRLLKDWKEAEEESRRIMETLGSHVDEARAKVEAFVRYRDMALEGLRRMYTDLADADDTLRRLHHGGFRCFALAKMSRDRRSVQCRRCWRVPSKARRQQ